MGDINLGDLLDAPVAQTLIPQAASIVQAAAPTVVIAAKEASTVTYHAVHRVMTDVIGNSFANGSYLVDPLQSISITNCSAINYVNGFNGFNPYYNTAWWPLWTGWAVLMGLVIVHGGIQFARSREHLFRLFLQLLEAGSLFLEAATFVVLWNTPSIAAWFDGYLTCYRNPCWFYAAFSILGAWRWFTTLCLWGASSGMPWLASNVVDEIGMRKSPNNYEGLSVTQTFYKIAAGYWLPVISAGAMWFTFFCMWLFLYSGLYIMQRRLVFSMGVISLAVALATGIFHAVTSDPIKKDERTSGCANFHTRTTVLHAIKTTLSASSLVIRALLVTALFGTFNENPVTLVGISFGLDQWAIFLLVLFLVDTGLFLWQSFVVDFTHMDNMSRGDLYAEVDLLAGQEVSDQRRAAADNSTDVEMSAATEGKAARKTPTQVRRGNKTYERLNVR